jgi:hypothetical protein
MTIKGRAEYDSDGEWRRRVDEHIEALQSGQRDMETRMTTLNIALTENTRTTKQVRQDTAQLLQILQASRMGAMALRWLAAMGMFIIAAIGMYRGFH